MLMLQRIDYLDIAKGFGIIFVILGHCMLGHNSSLHYGSCPFCISQN